MSKERGKVLVVIDDGEVRTHHTPSVEVACIVDGENMQLPIDWTGKLTQQITHTMPITVGFDQMFQEDGETSPDVVLEEGIFVDTERTKVSHCPPGIGVNRMKSPYCSDCDGNHPIGECPGKIDGYAERGWSHMIGTVKS